MEPLALLCILLGVLIVAVRAPLVFSPRATLRAYAALLSSVAGIRGVGVLLGLLALPLVVLAQDAGSLVGVLQALGWIFAFAALWLLLAPGMYRRLALPVLGFFESSIDMAIVRFVGVGATAIGLALIYAGLYVV